MTVVMKKFVEFSKKRFFSGCILALAALIITVCAAGQVKAGIVLSAMFIVAGSFYIDEGSLSDTVCSILYLIWFIVSSFAACFLSQLVLSESFISLGALRIVLGMLVCSVLFLLLFAVTLRPVFSVGLSTAVLVVFSAADHFVYEFRGSEINPSDILSIQTAGNVAAEYKFELTNPICYGFLLTAIFIFLSLGLPKIKNVKKTKTRMISLVLAGILTALYLPLSADVEPLEYKLYGSVQNGFILNFVLQLKETFVRKPDGYSLEVIREQADKYMNESEITSSAADIPDIIVIMDESFADLSKLGSELNINLEISPFIDSLSENTIRGYSLSSVFGGGTPNSEYEFLSGNSMMFLPTGSIVYQQYVKRPSYSMVSELKSNGYKCIAMHPFLSNGWARTTVYPHLGFDESYFLEDFSDDYMIRDYISDIGMFKKLTDLYEENKASDQDVFMFGVTMQNHGGYFYEGDHYEQTVFLDGYSQDYDDAEQYLSLIRETDIAVEYLINYFEKSENNVVVVFYGDHLPNLNNSFYEEVHGGRFESLDEQQTEYTVPFFIWTNYDIEEEEIDLTSFNFLSNYVYRAAGLDLPEYNAFLSDVEESIPAMNANGYYSRSQKCFIKYGEASGEEAEILNLYNQLQYNDMFDSKSRNEILFPPSTAVEAQE